MPYPHIYIYFKHIVWLLDSYRLHQIKNFWGQFWGITYCPISPTPLHTSTYHSCSIGGPAKRQLSPQSERLDLSEINLK